MISEDIYRYSFINTRRNLNLTAGILTPESPLSSSVNLQLKQRISKVNLKLATSENNPEICGVSFNSTLNELFFADWNNKVVRVIRLSEAPGDLRDVYRGRRVYSVCYMCEADTLLVISLEFDTDQKAINWLVGLNRNGIEWYEFQRHQCFPSNKNVSVSNDQKAEEWISCALSDSRALIGKCDSKYMELYRIESGPSISRVQHIETEWYRCFSATCSTETLVATSVSNYVHVHRLKENRLELREKIRLNDPYYLLYVLDRLLATEWDNGTDSVTEVSLRLERHRQLISPSERIRVLSWCALNDGIAIFDSTSRDMLLYSRIILDPIADYNRRERKSAAPTERRLSEAGQI